MQKDLHFLWQEAFLLSFLLHAQVLLIFAFASAVERADSYKVAVQSHPQRRDKASVNGYIYQKHWTVWVSTNLVLGWCEKLNQEQSY